MNTLNNIHKLIDKSSEAKLKIHHGIFHEHRFQEQQEALETLKKDPTVEVIEDEEKTEHETTIYDKNGEPIRTETEHWYKILTIKPKGANKKCQTN